MKIWDVRMENKPVQTFQVHEHLRPKLPDLYEKDQLFDKFKCVISGDGKYVSTGSYNNYFHIYDVQAKTDICLEATNNIPSRKKVCYYYFTCINQIIAILLTKTLYRLLMDLLQQSQKSLQIPIN